MQIFTLLMYSKIITHYKLYLIVVNLNQSNKNDGICIGCCDEGSIPLNADFPNQPAELAQSNERREDFKRKTEPMTVVFGLIVVIWFYGNTLIAS